MKPISIAGGGLAGLATALKLRRRGVPVSLFEAGHYPRHRVCGEFICPRDPALWERFGLDEELQGHVPAQTVVWVWPDGFRSRFALPHPARAMSRHRLDARLAEAFQKVGGELHTGTRMDRRQEEGRVCATGRVSGASGWIGLKSHYENLEVEADLEMHLGKGAYVGLCRIEEGRVNACGLFASQKLPGNRDRLMERSLRAFGLSDLAGRLEKSQVDPASTSAVSGLDFGARPFSNGVNLGDAWGMIPPFTGNGMSMALEGAALASVFLERYARGDLEWAPMCGQLNREMHRTFAFRVRNARLLHACLLGERRQKVLSWMAGRGFVPWKLLFGGLG